MFDRQTLTVFIVIGCILGFWVQSRQLLNSPRNRYCAETGQHTAMVTRISVDPQQRFWSVVHDKTAIMILRQDACRSCEFHRYILANQYCSNLPDGSTVAIGGWTGKRRMSSIFLNNAGKMINRVAVRQYQSSYLLLMGAILRRFLEVLA
jgi:hypothetical protein